jgi:hypothetical protein
MKLNESPVEIERGGSMIESAFGISEKDSVHIVNILRDKLYSNKILAVVREYSTNAQDAHAEAGKKDVPIRVTLPGPLDPTFRVRDFGPGLSEEDIRTVYALYGASTKRNSNEVVGQLGLGCLLKGEPIVTITGMKPVEEIKEKDIVLTHTGSWKEVTSTMNRKHSGKAYRIYLSQGGDPIIITDEHPVLIADSNGKTEWKLPGEITAGYRSKRKGIKSWNSYAVLPKSIKDSIAQIKTIDYLDSNFSFKNGTLFHKTEWEQTNRSTSVPFINHKEYEWENFPQKIPMNYETGWLLGLWAAEGSAGEKQLNLTLHINETSLANRFTKGMEKLFGVNFVNYPRPERNSQELVVSCVPLAQLLNKLCGHLAQNKHVPFEVMASNEETRNGFLDGLMDGDGSFTRDRFTFGVSSKDLAWGARTLMMEQNQWSTVGYLESPGTKENTNPRWSVNFNKKPKFSYHFNSKDYLCRPITKVEEFYLEEDVYNFSVEDDESYVGQFVLHNCKAAFAYTDKFNIVSWQGGIRKTYIAYIDETRLGKIALADTSADNEPDGIEIQVPVKVGEFHLFKSESEGILPYFRPQPELIGGTLVPREYTISGTTSTGADFGINLDHSYDVHIVMGGIPYSISMNNLTGKIDSKILSLFNLSIDIFVKIGDVDIAANRETLEFTDRTVDALKTYLTDIFPEIQKEADRRISKAITFRKANEMYHMLSISREPFWKAIAIPATWNGKKINGYIIKDDGNGYYEIYTPSRYRQNYKYYSASKIPAISCKILISIDNPDNWQRKLSEYLKANSPAIDYNNVVVIKWGSSITPKEMTELEDELCLKEYDYRLISDCKVVKVRAPKGTAALNSNRSTSHLGTIFRLKDEKLRSVSNSCPSANWERVLTVGPEEKYYVKLDKFKSEFPSEMLNTSDLCRVLKACHYMGLDIKDTDVYGVKAAKVDKLDNSWVPLVDVIKKAIEKSKITVELKDWRAYYDLPSQLKALELVTTQLPDKSPAKKLIEVTSELQKTFSKLSSNQSVIRDYYSSLCKVMKIELENVNPSYDVKPFIDEVRDRYPLLNKADIFPGGNRGYYGYVNDKSFQDSITEYINLIEDKRKRKGV